MLKRIAIISCEEGPETIGIFDNALQYGFSEKINNISNLRKQISKLGFDDITLIHHTELYKLDVISPTHILLSGRFYFPKTILPFNEMLEEYQTILNWIPNANVPVMGICMGLQLICAAYGVGTVRLPSLEGEFGFTEIQKVKNHSIFAHTNHSFSCFEMHHCEVERLPEHFELLASSKLCKMQMIVHESKPIFGLQFHPEICTEIHSDGLSILNDFLNL